MDTTDTPMIQPEPGITTCRESGVSKYTDRSYGFMEEKKGTGMFRSFLFGAVVLIMFASTVFAGTSGRDSRVISRAFELRYVTADPRADAETDFKGETEVFRTEEPMCLIRRNV